ncbi:MAG: HEAT repeat domain-containing protein, partial [Xenococcaceae cyanobacterium]
DEDSSVRRIAANALEKIGSEAAIPALIQALEDEDSSVRRIAANALEKIGSEAAIPALIQALEDEDSSVRWNAAEAYKKIGLPYHPKTLLANAANYRYTFSDAIKALEAVQERCQFYTYTLTQSILISKPQPTILPVPHISISTMHILHLSDLHFGTLDQANLWSNQLAEDLHNELDIHHLDALILSGDIANYSTPKEYEAAQKFLNNLRQDFPLAPKQIIIVPGNHDLNWQISEEEAYTPMRRKAYKGAVIEVKGEKKPDPNCAIDKGEFVEVLDPEQYKRRFEHFSNFYQAIKDEPYPLDYDQQYILNHLPEQNLLILGLNSAWQLDHHYKSRASIHPNALGNALTDIRRNQEYQNCLKIAVWHHPLKSPYEDRIKDDSFMGRLAVSGFCLFLHGHVHQAQTDFYSYDTTPDGRKLHRICAGTFGAPTQELVTATPWQYNLLKLEGNQIKVQTRKRESETGAWESDARWRRGKGQPSLDYYTIEF